VSIATEEELRAVPVGQAVVMSQPDGTTLNVALRTETFSDDEWGLAGIREPVDTATLFMAAERDGVTLARLGVVE
jgi:hypothetical protein